MEFTSCPWNSFTQFPANFCEINLCAWIVQPANTWSNISYQIAAIFIFLQKDWRAERYRFSFIVFCLFIGSTAFHMTSTVVGREMDVGAMLMLSSFSLSYTLSRSYKHKLNTTVIMSFVLFMVSIPAIPKNMGSILFLIQFLITAMLEFIYARKNPPPKAVRKSLLISFCLFMFALFLNIMDMNKINCIPPNPFISLHAIWHLICGYCIFLLVEYYCYQEIKS
jgi:hypothetical protein